MSKEIPILFSTPMVQAILAGRKTMTRRLVGDYVDEYAIAEMITDAVVADPDAVDIVEKQLKGVCVNFDDGEWIIKSRWQPGDLLWVREAWQMIGWSFEDGTMTVKYKDGKWLDCYAPDPKEDSSWMLNYVEHLEEIGCLKKDPNDEERFLFTDKPQPWKPSIHMPKNAARIWLEVTDVRVDRLQSISPGDACDEGINYWNIDPEAMEGGELQADFENYTWTDKKENDPNYEDRYFPTFANPVDSFRTLWQSINGKESWEANPWVWVVSFKVLSTTGKP